MKRIGVWMGAMFALCLSVFAMPAMAGTAVAYAYAHNAAVSSAEYGASGAKFDLTLAQWRQGSSGTENTLPSGLRAESNHFAMTTAVVLGSDERPDV